MFNPYLRSVQEVVMDTCIAEAQLILEVLITFDRE